MTTCEPQTLLQVLGDQVKRQTALMIDASWQYPPSRRITTRHWFAVIEQTSIIRELYRAARGSE